SIQDSDIYYSWILWNKQTKQVISVEEVNSALVKFDLRNVSFGNYYLYLVINHLGNEHRVLIKRPNISKYSNESFKNKSVSMAFSITQKNTFFIKLSPVRFTDKVKWGVTRRKKKTNTENSNVFLNKFAKKVIYKLPIRKKWIVFESHMGKQYSDSPKYIYESLLKEKRRYNYIWSFENPESVNIPGTAIKVKRNSLKHI